MNNEEVKVEEQEEQDDNPFRKSTMSPWALWEFRKRVSVLGRKVRSLRVDLVDYRDVPRDVIRSLDDVDSRLNAVLRSLAEIDFDEEDSDG